MKVDCNAHAASNAVATNGPMSWPMRIIPPSVDRPRARHMGGIDSAKYACRASDHEFEPTARNTMEATKTTRDGVVPGNARVPRKPHIAAIATPEPAMSADLSPILAIILPSIGEMTMETKPSTPTAAEEPASSKPTSRAASARMGMTVPEPMAKMSAGR